MWNRIVKKVHVYLGLLSFTQFLIYGAAGLIVTFHHGAETPLAPASVEFMDFVAPPKLTDREVAIQVYSTVKPRLASPLPTDWPLRRDPRNNLCIEFHSLDGVQRVTVLEKENRLKVENVRDDFWRYLNRLHAVAFEYVRAPVSRMWAVYNEFAMFSLIAMALSGVFLWISSRPGFFWGKASFGAGIVSFAVLYFLIR